METQSSPRRLLSQEEYHDLKSIYLERDYKNDLVTIDNIEVIGKHTLRSTLNVKQFTLDKENVFHLSSVTAMALAQQLAIILMLIDLDKTKNDLEFYTTDMSMKMLKPINSKSITLEAKIHSSKIKNGYKIYELSADFQDNSFYIKAVGLVKV